MTVDVDPGVLLFLVGAPLVLLCGALVVIARRRQVALSDALSTRTGELERALEKLALSESRFRQLAGASEEGVIVHDNGRSIDANESAKRLFGRDSAAFKGADVASLFADESRPAVQAALRGFSTAPLHAMVRRSDGATLSLEVISKVAPANDGSIGILAVRDITERDELQRRLLLADRIRSLGTLAAGAAHEINNPLAYVLLNMEFIDEQLQDLESSDGARARELRALVAEAREGCDRITRIVRDLQTLSPEDGAPAAPVDLPRVMRAMAKVALHEIRPRARLSEHYGPTPAVSATEGRLGQICLNLLTNAAQAIEPGHPEHNEIRLVTRTDGDHAVLEVSDTGKGIESDVLPRIFDPFFTTRPVGTGAGLGLSIVHTLVAALGGRITVESRGGVGSTFVVTLPGAVEAATASAPPPSSDRFMTRGSILIVDDEPALARALARGLPGWSATFAANATDAIAILERETFDVVLCDMTMPGRSGLDVYDFVRQSRPILLRRFLMMTGGSLPDEVVGSLRSTSTPCLSKPLSARTLRLAIGDLTDPKSEPREDAG